MKYCSVREIARKWGVSERSVRNYCADGRVEGAFLTGKTWNIPETAAKPERKARKAAAASSLLEVLRKEKQARLSGGIYHRVQIDLTYNSNHIEGSRLTHDQTRWIFETATVDIGDEPLPVDDIVETANHFRCIDFVIDSADKRLSEPYIKQLHSMLKSGTTDSRRDWFAVGDYKRHPNEVGGRPTAPPEAVHGRMQALLNAYNRSDTHTLEDLIDFHVSFERIHPFQDGNGRVGRLILFKECLKYGIVPFIIDEWHKLYYYRGLQEWPQEKGYLVDTCLSAQDAFKAVLAYFRIG